MKLVALLAWYDEDPEHLRELVESLGKVGVDALVAVDGAYRLYPNAMPFSGIEQHRALKIAACQWTLDLTVYVPAWPWEGNEIEKRNQLFRLGHAIAEPYEDWLWVIDTDETVTKANNLREDLKRTGRNVGTVMEITPDSPPKREPRLFRAHSRGIHVHRIHSCYRNGDGDVLWGREAIQPTDLDVEVAHCPLMRSEARTEARNAYYAAMKEHKAEVEVF